MSPERYRRLSAFQEYRIDNAETSSGLQQAVNCDKLSIQRLRVSVNLYREILLQGSSTTNDESRFSSTQAGIPVLLSRGFQRTVLGGDRSKRRKDLTPGPSPWKGRGEGEL
jgi:hypothetical protein